MTADTLDRSRPYGTVHGETTDGAFFEQDGLLFDNEGLLLEHLMTAEQKKSLELVKAKRHAEAMAQEAYAAAMKDAGMTDVPPGAPPVIVSENAPPPAADPGDAKVDLLAWMKGEQKYQFFAVTKAMREQYGFAASDKSSVVKFLQDTLNLPDSAIRV
jgi:hypothetical protein